LERTVNTELHRSARSRRLPARFRDALPTSVMPVHLIQQSGARDQQLQRAEDTTEPTLPPDPGPQRDTGIEDTADSENPPRTRMVTNANSFGVFREYFTTSSHHPRNPDAFADVSTATIAPQPQSIGSGLTIVTSAESEHDPLVDSKNRSEDLLLAWMTVDSGNTPAGMNHLVHNVIRHPDFTPSDLENFNAVTAVRKFGREYLPSPGSLKAGDGWKEGSVRIRVPCTGVRQKESNAPEFVINGVLYRDVVEVITAELKDPDSFSNIHTTPYEEWWRPSPGEDPVRVYSEIYNSDAMLQADKKMQDDLETMHGPESALETFIVSALLYSDSTHLASFGSASLWPVYLFLGNVSKYIRSKPTSFSAHHIAYIPTVRSHDLVTLRSVFDQIRIAPRLSQGVLPGTLRNRPHERNAHPPGAGAYPRGSTVDPWRVICRRP
jgi:hypothetical protein